MINIIDGINKIYDRCEPTITFRGAPVGTRKVYNALVDGAKSRKDLLSLNIAVSVLAPVIKYLYSNDIIKKECIKGAYRGRIISYNLTNRIRE